MKEKLKKIYSLIVICMIFAFCSCEKENIETTNQKNTNIVAFKNVSLKDLGTSKTNIKLIESANNIKKLKSNTQSQNKIEYNSLYDFYIDPDSGKYIETTDSKNYTFLFTEQMEMKIIL